MFSIRIFFTLSIFLSFSQVNRAQWSVGLFGEPNYQFSKFGESEAPNSDSVSALHNNSFRFSLGMELINEIDRVQSLHIRAGYYNYGFMLQRQNLQLFDVIHPSLGQLLDQSQAATKNAYMHHRFKYAGLELEYMRNLRKEPTAEPVEFHLGGGLGFFYLIEHDLRIRTEGFAVDGEFVHVIKDSLLFEPNQQLLSLHIAAETRYLVSPKVEVFGKLIGRAPLIGITKGSYPIYNWMPALNAGVLFNL